MKRLYCNADGMKVGYLKQVLEDHGIQCLVKTEYLAGAVGEIPPIECWPELWVLDPECIEAAQRLMKSIFVEAVHSAESWQCRVCGEDSEGQFTDCWSAAQVVKGPCKADALHSANVPHWWHGLPGYRKPAAQIGQVD